MDIYDLTPLTLKANEGRRISFQGFDLDRRHFWIVVCSSVVVLPVVSICYQVLGMGVLALLLAPILYALPFFLIETRSQEGLKLRRYQALLDSRTGNTGKFMVCNKEIQPATYRPRLLRALSLPVAGSTAAELKKSPSDSLDELFT